jgi:propionyl-CoA synthetase
MGWGKFAITIEVITKEDQYFYRWFKGGQVNICYNCVDRHVDNGNGDDTALIFDSAYNQLS